MRARPGESDPLRPITGNVSTLGTREDGARLDGRGGEPCPQGKRVPPVYRVAGADANRPGRSSVG